MELLLCHGPSVSRGKWVWGSGLPRKLAKELRTVVDGFRFRRQSARRPSRAEPLAEASSDENTRLRDLLAQAARVSAALGG
jgi:hypothetical protein